MAKRIQLAKISIGCNTYTIVREFDGEVRAMLRVYKKYSEWSDEHGRKDHKVQIEKTPTIYGALTAITSDFSGRQMVMIPATYLMELQSLREAQQ